MKLISLEVNNFRSFYSKHKISFSTDPKKPLTIITGFNGGGKTNLLNAIYWCLTGLLTPSFKQPKNLVNFDAFNEDENARAYVEVIFDADGVNYRARRSYDYQTDKDTFTIFKIETFGDSTLINNPQNFIQRYVPKGLANWFFYDAEAVGKLKLSGSAEFKTSLRKTLGFELIDILIEDLKQALRKRERDYARNAQSENLTKINKDIDQKDRFIGIITEEITAFETELKDVDKNYNEKNDELAALPQTTQLRSDEKRLKLSLKSKSDERAILVSKRKKFQGESIPSILIDDLAIPLGTDLKQKENSGKLPASYSELLLEEILEKKECICGREVEDQSKEHLHIESLFKSAATTEFNNKVRNIQAFLKDIHRTKEDYLEKLNDFRTTETKLNNEISGLETSLKLITEQLSGIPEEKIQKLIAERATFFDRRTQLFANRSIKKLEIENYKTEIQRLNRVLEAETQKVGISQKVQEDLNKLKLLISHTEKSLRDREVRSLNVLSLELNSLLSKYLRKHYRAEINRENYQVKMFNEHGHETPDSTGEGEVLKYIFLATVVSLASKKTVDKIDFLSEPIIAPLVFDAPFTSLDPLYKKQVASNLVEQAEQLILFVLPGNLTDENISSALKPREGKRYVLISREKGEMDEKEIGKVVIDNKEIVLNEYGCERSESIIKEI